MQCLGIKEVQDPDAENDRMLMKSIKDLNKWEDTPGLWIRRLNIEEGQTDL